WLIQFKPRRTERPARNFTAVSPCRGNRNIQLAERIVAVETTDVFKVPTGAEGAAGAIEHRNGSIFIGIKTDEGGGEFIGALRVHGVPRLGSIMNNRPYRSVLLDPDCHVIPLSVSDCDANLTVLNKSSSS